MGFGLIVDENVPKGEFLNLCTKENLINSDDLYFDYCFKNVDPKHKKLKWPDFEYSDNENFISPDILRFIFNLGYHYSHIKKSVYKDELLLLLYEDYNNLVFAIRPSELELIRDFEDSRFYDFIMKNR